jgi:hypothetical protein
MIDTNLVGEKTTVSAKGDSASLDLSEANGRVFLITLDITRIIEQESIEVSIIGSADGASWEAKPVVMFPQEFYTGQYPLLLDLRQHPNVKFVRAHWEVARWGRGTETPMFEFGLKLKEVPSDVLRDLPAVSRVPA